MVRFCAGGYQSPKGAVGKMRRISAFVYDGCIPSKVIPKHMKEYFERTKRTGRVTK